MRLSTLDIAIIIVYLIGMLSIGFIIARWMRGGFEFFLAGKRLPWWAIGASLVATDIGATDMIGLAGSAYVYGLVLANYDWIGCIPAMLLCAFVFVPYFWRCGVYTIPEYLGRRFNDGVRLISAIFWIVFSTFNIGLILYVSASTCQDLVGSPFEDPDHGKLFWVAAAALFVGIYTFSGGLAAIVMTDVAQVIVMMLGAAVALVVGLVEVGGISALVERIEALGKTDHFRLVVSADTNTTYAWPAVFFGLALVMSPAYWIGNQAIVQRALGARTEFDAKAGIVAGSFLKLLVPVLLVFPGIIALAIFPNLEKGDKAIPTLLSTLLPSGVRGVVFAGFLAALMSSVDSYINSAATLWTKEIYQRFLVRSADDRHYLVVGRVVTVILIIVAIITSYIPSLFDSIYTYFQTMLSTFQGPAFAVILLGMTWKRATGAGALAGLVAGLSMSVPFNLFPQVKRHFFTTQDPFLYVAWWSFCLALAVTVAVSLFTKPKSPAELAGLVYERRGGRS